VSRLGGTPSAGAALGDSLGHVPKFGGALWFVSKSGSDSNEGSDPHRAFLTLGHAISEAAAGDAITVQAGTYAEAGIDVNKAALELWFEIGVTLAPATGTALVVSGGSNRIRGPLLVMAVAGEIGVQVTGAMCSIEDVRVSGGATGFSVASVGNTLLECRANAATAIGFSVSVGQNRLAQCATVGAGGSTIGYDVNAGSDYGLMMTCTSAGHGSAGFKIESGSSGWTMHHCSSGAGDGPRIDEDGVNVWSGYTFDDDVTTHTIFVGGSASPDNLYRIYGTVLVSEFYGHVETVLAADIGTGYLELDDGTVQVDVTDSPGPSFDDLVAGSYLHKIDDAGTQINIQQADQVRLYEDASKFGEDPVFSITAKHGVATYLRLVWSGVGTSGLIHWHLHYRPITEDGFVVAA